MEQSKELLRKRRDGIKQHVANADFGPALDDLMDFIRDYYPKLSDDTILIKSSYKSLQREELSGRMGLKDADLGKADIAYRILQTLSLVPYDAQQPKEVNKEIISSSGNIEEKNEALKLLKATIAQILQTNDQENDLKREVVEKTLADLAKKLKLPNEIILKAQNIKKSYPGSNFKFELEKLELRQGEIIGLVGENATGKTTLLRILAGDLACDAGQLAYPLFDPKNWLFWPALKTKIAYIPQELPVWQGSLLENLRLEAALHGLKGVENQVAVKFIVERLGLKDYEEKNWRELSGGYKLRFALAKAMIWNPELLIIDEPLAFLDVKTQLMVLSDLRKLASSLRHPISIILSSQQIHEIEKVVDQMLFMKGGQLRHLGRRDEWGKTRTVNVFELETSIDFSTFGTIMEAFPHKDIWSNEMSYFVSTPVDISGQDFLKFLMEKQIPLNHFRDISSSVKIQFYEAYL